MRSRPGPAWSLVAAAALALPLLSVPCRAEKINFERIEGRWCGDITDYKFTRQRLTVTFQKDGTHRVLEVERIDSGDGWINFIWKSGGNTVFSEFSRDGKSMAQDANKGGDNGPRREFRRC